MPFGRHYSGYRPKATAKPIFNKFNIEKLASIPEKLTAPAPREDIRGARGPTITVGVPPRQADIRDNQLTTGSATDAGTWPGLVNWYKRTDAKVTNKIADTLNVKPKTVKTMSLISLIGTGAGLLANGVKSLFDGTLKEKRAEKKAEKRAKKESKWKKKLEESYAETYGSGTVAGGGPAPPQQPAPKQDVGNFIQKNWMWIALAVLVLFGGKLFKPKRTYRRRAQPKTVVRYRTRKAPTRRRRRR